MSASSRAIGAPLPPTVEEPLRLPVGQRPCAPEHAPDFRYRPEIGQVVCERCYATDWPVRPQVPCQVCGKDAWWERPVANGGGWLCGRCHPPVHCQA